MNKIEKLIAITDALARECEFDTQMGAILVRRSVVIGVGYAKHTSRVPKRIFESHPRSSKWFAIHAEIAALKNALRGNSNINGSTVIVSGFTKGGNRPVSCRPCGPCVEILKEYHVQNVIYATPDGIEESKLADIDETIPVCTSCDQRISGWSRFNGPYGHR